MAMLCMILAILNDAATDDSTNDSGADVADDPIGAVLYDVADELS